jgi:hypothetical protein
MMIASGLCGLTIIINFPLAIFILIKYYCTMNNKKTQEKHTRKTQGFIENEEISRMEKHRLR